MTKENEHKDASYTQAEEKGCFIKHCWDGWKKFVFIALIVGVLCAIIIPIASGEATPTTTVEIEFLRYGFCKVGGNDDMLRDVNSRLECGE